MTQTPIRLGRAGVIVGVFLLGSLTGSAAALAQDTDPRWYPWLGCWQLWEEQLDPSALPQEQALDDETAALLDRTYVCVRPSDTAASVELTATAGERVLVERTLVADSVRRDLDEPACRGWEQSEWSFDGRRLFTHAELQCGDEPRRTVTGVSLLTSTSIWVDIQVVELGTQQLVEVRRYTPVTATQQAEWLGSAAALGVDPADIRQARREAAAQMSLRDLEEASQKTTARVVETLLVETEPRLPLDSEALIALDDAGISGGVIDLLVGLSYPDHFVVERRDRGGSWSSNTYRGFGGFGGYHDPLWYNSFYPYYVTPLGYYSYGRGYSPYAYGLAATPFVVVPTANEVDASSGRAIRDRGYTRVTPRSPVVREAVPRGASASPGGYSSGGGTSSRTGGGSSSGGGSSRGGSSSGRTAVPRR